MKKFLIIVAVLIIGAGAWLFMAMKEGAALDASSRQFVETQIPRLANGKWYGPLLRPIVHTDFMEAVSMEQWQQVSTLYWQKLGKINRLSECTGQAHIMYGDEGKKVTAKYLCDASFEHANANVEMNLQQQNGEWKLYNINITSSAFQ